MVDFIKSYWIIPRLKWGALIYLGTLSLGSLDNNIWNIIVAIFSIVLTILVYLFILWLFVFKTSWLIDKLHLEKGFEEEEIAINMSLSNILSIAIIVIGGLMLIKSLPLLCKQIFTFSQQKYLWRESPTTGWIILYFLQAILGYILITKSKLITTFINKKTCSDSTIPNGNEQNE